MVNQAFRIKIAYRSKEKKKKNTRDRSVPDGSAKKTLFYLLLLSMSGIFITWMHIRSFLPIFSSKWENNLQPCRGFFYENLHLKELVVLGSSKSKQLFSYCKHLFPRQNNAVCPLFGEATYENAKKDLI